MGWGEAKDAILIFLASGLSCWVAWEVRTLRIAIERVIEKVDGHEKRIEWLEDRL